jgi:hypothetical protein
MCVQQSGTMESNILLARDLSLNQQCAKKHSIKDKEISIESCMHVV